MLWAGDRIVSSDHTTWTGYQITLPVQEPFPASRRRRRRAGIDFKTMGLTPLFYIMVMEAAKKALLCANNSTIQGIGLGVGLSKGTQRVQSQTWEGI